MKAFFQSFLPFLVMPAAASERELARQVQYLKPRTASYVTGCPNASRSLRKSGSNSSSTVSRWAVPFVS
jgi:hypothetical protein